MAIIKTGTYRFNDVLSASSTSWSFIPCNFIVNEPISTWDTNIFVGFHTYVSEDGYFTMSYAHTPPTEGFDYEMLGLYSIYNSINAWGSKAEDQNARTITISSDQEVSDDFYEWFMANATEVKPKTLKGTWKFNETIIMPEGNLEHSLSFTSNDEQFISIEMNHEQMDYDSDNPITAYTISSLSDFSGWQDEKYRTITFTSEQEVAEEFYAWFTANAVEQKTIQAGTYRFHDMLSAMNVSHSFPANYSDIRVFISNGVTYDYYMAYAIVNDPGTGREPFQLVYRYEIDSENYHTEVVYDNCLSGEWTDATYQTITIPNDTEVSAEFYEWFTANAVEQKEISGKWKFKDVLTLTDGFNQPIDFTITVTPPDLGFSVKVIGDAIVPSSNIPEVGFRVVSSDPDLSEMGFSLPVVLWLYRGGVWDTDFYGEGVKTFDFGTTPQYVSAEFYNWMTANAIEQKELSGKWRFKDVLTAPSADIETTLNFSVDTTISGINVNAKCDAINVYNIYWDEQVWMKYNLTSTTPNLGIPLPTIIGIYDDGTEPMWETADYGEGIKTIDFGTEPQSVSVDFYNWFTANAVEQKTIQAGTYRFNDNPTNLGYSTTVDMSFTTPTWSLPLSNEMVDEVNAQITASGAGYPLVEYGTVLQADYHFSQFHFCYLEHNGEYSTQYYCDSVTYTPNHPIIPLLLGDETGRFREAYRSFDSEKWAYAEWQTITILADTEVSAEFYEWFTANAVEQKTIKAGTYRFNDVLSAPSAGIDQSVNFNVDVVNVLGDGLPYTAVCTNISFAGEQMTMDVDHTVPENTDLAPSSYDVYFDGYGWLVDYYGDNVQTITFPTDSEVSSEFYEWFTANAVEKKNISGVWKFNNDLTAPSNLNEVVVVIAEVNGACNGVPFNALGAALVQHADEELPAVFAVICGDIATGDLPYLYISEDYDTYSAGWQSEAYKTIDFGTEPQYVSPDFYDWFTANAVEQKEISGKWRFKDEITAPAGGVSSGGVNFTTESLGYIVHCNDLYVGEYPEMTYVVDSAPAELEQYLGSLGVTLPWPFLVVNGGTWDTDFYGEGVKTIDFGAESQYVSDEFYEWFIANASPAMASITYNGSTIASLFGGETATLKCAGMKMETDVVVAVGELPESNGSGDGSGVTVVPLTVTKNGVVYDARVDTEVWDSNTEYVWEATYNGITLNIKKAEKLSVPDDLTDLRNSIYTAEIEIDGAIQQETLTDRIDIAEGTFARWNDYSVLWCKNAAPLNALFGVNFLEDNTVYITNYLQLIQSAYYGAEDVKVSLTAFSEKANVAYCPVTVDVKSSLSAVVGSWKINFIGTRTQFTEDEYVNFTALYNGNKRNFQAMRYSEDSASNYLEYLGDDGKWVIAMSAINGWSDGMDLVDFGSVPQIVTSTYKEWLSIHATPKYTIVQTE